MFQTDLEPASHPEVPNPNSQIPGKVQSFESKRKSPMVRSTLRSLVLHFGIWDLMLYLGIGALDLEFANRF